MSHGQQQYICCIEAMWFERDQEAFCLPCPRQEDVIHDRRPAHATNKAENDRGNGEGDDPVDVLGEEYGVSPGRATVEMRRDEGPAQIAGHGIVGDSAGEEADGEQVVEDALAVAGTDHAQDSVDELLCDS